MLEHLTHSQKQPDYSLPNIPEPETPAINSKGDYIGSAQCESRYPTQRPPVPYGQQDDTTDALWFEEGFKECVGYLTEGRYLVFEKAGSALTNPGNSNHLATSPATTDHDTKSQRWVIHYTDDVESEIFTISSALDGRWLGSQGILLPKDQSANASAVRLYFLGNGRGYTLQYADSGEYIDVNSQGSLNMASLHQHSKNSTTPLMSGMTVAMHPVEGYKVWSVSYRN